MKTLRTIFVALVLAVTALGAAAGGNHWMVGLEGMARSGQTEGKPNWGLELSASYRVNLGKIFFVRPYAGFSYLRPGDDVWVGGPIVYEYRTIWNAMVGGDLGARIVGGLDVHTGPVVIFPFKDCFPVRGSWRFGVGYTIWKLYVSAAFEKRMTYNSHHFVEYPNWVFGVHYMF